jgi:hypothetical protein
MKLNWLALMGTVVPSTLFILAGTVTGFGIANPHLPSDSLLAETALPLIVAGVFSLTSGYVASRPARSFASGAVGGAVNALANLGVLLLVLSIWDRHFIAIGGRRLVAWLPLVALLGALVGMMGAGVRNLLTKRVGVS